MELFYFSIFLFAITPSNALERIEGINGSVTDLEFDYNCNTYGVENIPKFKNNKWAFPIILSIYDWKSFLFKLGPDQTLEWKVQFSDGIEGELRDNSIFHKTRILINRQNDVYLVVEKKELTEIFTLMMNDSVPTLRKISEYSSPTSISQAFIVDDNIIIAGLQDEKMPSRSTIKVLKVNSGKWLTIASSERNSFHVAKDNEDNIYFTKDDSGRQQIFVLSKDSLTEDNPTPSLVPNVINDKENVTNLKIGHRNELYIELYDNSTSFVKIKKFADNNTKTIFAKPGTHITLSPVTKGAYIKYFKEEGNVCEDPRMVNMNLTFESVYVNEDNKIIPLSHYTSWTNNPKNVAGNRQKTLNTDKALTDKEENLYFEHYVPNESKHYVHYRNHTSEEIVQIKFEPELSEFFFVKEKDMLFDEDENVLIFVKEGSSTSYLYFLKKGTLTAKKIFDYEDMMKIRKSRDDNVYVTSHTGLFVKGSSKTKMNCNNFM